MCMLLSAWAQSWPAAAVLWSIQSQWVTHGSSPHCTLHIAITQCHVITVLEQWNLVWIQWCKRLLLFQHCNRVTAVCTCNRDYTEIVKWLYKCKWCDTAQGVLQGPAAGLSVPRFEGRVDGHNPCSEVGVVYSCKPSLSDHVQERLLQWDMGYV